MNGLTYAGSGQSERTAAGGTTFASSPMGLQASATSGSITYFLRDPTGNLIGEETPDDNHWYYLKDGVGSVVAVVNDSGSVVNRYGYDPYGNVTTSSATVSNPWSYASGYMDTTGLIKFGTRYYDSTTGRFTQLIRRRLRRDTTMRMTIR